MPIRFRCVYCDKLLGIARRKAGAVVSCPHCGEKLIVPTPEPESAGADQGPVVDEAPVIESEEDKELMAAGLFERSDFEALLQPQPTLRSADESPPAPKKPLRPKAVSPPASIDAPELFPALSDMPLPQYIPPAPKPSVAPAPPPGFYISPSKATWLSVLAVILLAVAFAGGLMVGRFLRPS
jgi:DNA-directed RNA polymerase subunit RPC12/RpoP